MMLLLPLSRSATAAHIDRFEVTRHDDGYEMTADAVIRAPADQVLALLTDYAHLDRINPDITASSFATGPSGVGERVRTVAHSCVWFFCRKLVQVEDVTQPDARTIVAHIVPGEDFVSGSSLWQLRQEGPDTHLHYEATRKLAFWVPPFVGSAALKHSMREHFTFSIQALERLADHNS
jgi:hypothetical protein